MAIAPHLAFMVLVWCGLLVLVWVVGCGREGGGIFGLCVMCTGVCCVEWRWFMCVVGGGGAGNSCAMLKCLFDYFGCVFVYGLKFRWHYYGLCVSVLELC